MIRFRLSPRTATVLGSRVKETDARWTGLDLKRAELRAQSSLMRFVCGDLDAPPDLHLSVPWCHPDDQTGDPEDFDSRYRVRPMAEPGRRWLGRMVKSVAFERYGDDWIIAVDFASKLTREAIEKLKQRVDQ